MLGAVLCLPPCLVLHPLFVVASTFLRTVGYPSCYCDADILLENGVQPELQDKVAREKS